METFISLVFVAISIAAPFVFLHLFARYFYHLSLLNIVFWWFKNHKSVRSRGAYLMGLFFVFLLIIVLFSGLMNIIFLSIFGERQELVYLGHSKEAIAVYYDKDDLSRKTFSGYDVDKNYNYSFDNLFRAQTFIKPPGFENEVGAKKNRFHIIGLIAILLGSGLLVMVSTAFFNTLVHPVYKDKPTDIDLPSEGAQLAFNRIIARYGLSEKQYYGGVFIIFIVWVGFLLSIPENSMSEPLLSIADNIRPGAQVAAVPVDLAIRYVRQRHSSSSNDYHMVDSGERYVTFEFNKGFEVPVYVTTIIDLEKYTKQIPFIEQSIGNAAPMQVLVNDDLSISIPLDSQVGTGQ